MSAIIRLIALLNTFVFCSSRVTIGNYSELNPKDCGISRVSSEIDSSCFKWHKDTDPQLKKGKNVSNGDAPWMALVISSSGQCSGAVVANQWILTAAHCVKGSFGYEIRIYLGHNFTRHNLSLNTMPYYTGVSVFIHPKYNKQTVGKYDLALVKMDRKISYGNSICLPQKVSRNASKEYEYVMVGGWGGPTGILKLAYWRMTDLTEPNTTMTLDATILDYMGWFAMTFKLDKQGFCDGDSGSPVWQYHMGRAVIAGVFVKGNNEEGKTCEADHQEVSDQGVWEGAGFAIRVDPFVDWIQNVTNLE